MGLHAAIKNYCVVWLSGLLKVLVLWLSLAIFRGDFRLCVLPCLDCRLVELMLMVLLTF